MYPKVESNATFDQTHRLLKQIQKVLDEQQARINGKHRNNKDLPHYIENTLQSVNLILLPEKKLKLQISCEVQQTLFLQYGGSFSPFQGGLILYRNTTREYSTYSSLLRNFREGLQELYEARILRHQEEKDGMDIPY